MHLSCTLERIERRRDERWPIQEAGHRPREHRERGEREPTRPIEAWR